MSHPLKRRMAKAALLLAAGTAPVVGTVAGQASAAEPVPGGRSGLSVSEADDVSHTLDAATETAVGLTEQVGEEAMKAAMPIVGPLAHEAAVDTGRTAHDAGGLLGGLSGQVARTSPSPYGPGTPSTENPAMGLSLPL